MNGDFARVTFDRTARFSRVLLQQGRILLEADFNEQSAIHHHFLRTLVVDLIGRRWRAGAGFSIAINPQRTADFIITRGHFYVDGILCENDADRSYSSQPWPHLPEAERTPSPLGAIAYLECWERHVNALQYPDLRDVALGGIDTASRAQVVWQVRTATQASADLQLQQVMRALTLRMNTLPAAERSALQAELDRVHQVQADFADALSGFPGAEIRCGAANAMLDALDAAPPLMRARAAHDAADDDPCAMSADAAFRSRENQLYRIEVHAGGMADGQATIKWSRENGSVMFALRGGPRLDPASNTITVSLDSLGHDHRTGLCEGQWVELTGDAFEFTPVTPPLSQVTEIDRTRRTVKIALHQATTADFLNCTLLKRWDQHDGVNQSGTIEIEESGAARWIAIERGVEVQFVPGGRYRSGDYWLVPARVVSRDVGWPQAADGPQAIVPHGVQRHRAALAYLKNPQGAGWEFGACGCSQQPLCP